MHEEWLKKRELLMRKIRELEDELNEEKDNEDTWGGHENPGYMNLEEDLRTKTMMLKDLDEMIKKYALSRKK